MPCRYAYEILLELFGEKKVFFFDEIQNAPQWENFVRRMQDSGFKFYLTGSNASLLSKELGAKLTGRSISVELYPFSFLEFLLYRGYVPKKNALFYTSERGRIKRYFSEYLASGGMPEYLKYREINILKMVYEDILYRDIVARYEIKGIKALRELALYLASNLTRPFTYNSLKRMLQLGSVNTVKSYVDYLENSFLFFATPRFSYSVKQQYTAPRKIYGIDNGLIGSVAFQFSKNRGLFLENLVFLELKRRYKNIYYCKTMKNLEVDFLIKKENQTISLIQVTESLSDELTRKRELNSLLAAMEELKLKEGLILTEDHEEKIKVSDRTIRVQPIYKWLLSNE
ncbi:MAG: ATP-binding protein [Candidatus Omnitrophota bacterium]